MARRQRRSGKFSTYFFALLAVCGVGIVIFFVAENFTQKTTVIESGVIGNIYTADAVIARNEDLTDVEGLTSVRYFANEGAHVGKGEKIAEVYASGYSQTDINRLLNIRAEIKSSVKTILSSAYSDAQLDRYDEQVLDYAREVGMLVSGTATGNLLNLERQLTSALEQRQSYIKSQYYNVYPPLAELYDNETSQVKKIQTWTHTYLADRDCIVSFYTDGYESMLSFDTVTQITAAEVRGILGGAAPTQTTSQRGRTPVFRQVTPSGWYLFLLTKDETWNPANGQELKVKLRGFDDAIISGVVDDYNRSGNELLVRLYVAGDVRAVLNIRTAAAEISETNMEGLKVPLNALRSQNGQPGVVLTDQGGVFVPVTLIHQDHLYAYIQSLVPGALWEGQKIRTF